MNQKNETLNKENRVTKKFLTTNFFQEVTIDLQNKRQSISVFKLKSYILNWKAINFTTFKTIYRNKKKNIESLFEYNWIYNLIGFTGTNTSTWKHTN